VTQTKLEYAKRKFERRREMRSAAAELKLAQDNRKVAALDAEVKSALLARRMLRAPFNRVVADQLPYVACFSTCRIPISPFPRASSAAPPCPSMRRARPAMRAET
jgi:hypothetical protein